jgi:hypothetical protein
MPNQDYYSDARMDGTKRRMAAAVDNPYDQARIKMLQNWFANDKPAIDRRANKYKKTSTAPASPR